MVKQTQNTEHSGNILYISLEQSIAVNKKQVKIGDIASIFCSNPEVAVQAKKLPLFSFSDYNGIQQVVSVMKLIELISVSIDGITIESTGCPETIVYFKKNPESKKLITRVKACFLMLIAFFGAAFSIMSYNTDITVDKLLNNLHEIYVGEVPTGPSVGMLFYSIGLFIGVIIFFNHGITQKLTDDPTPLQVQMRLYEQDVNNTIIIDSKRNNKTLDTD